MTLIKSLVADEMFLQGKYLNIGINGSGTLGSSYTAPTGIFTNRDIGFIRLGMWADFDGFGVGKAPMVQEAVLKGTGVEGFSIGYKSAAGQIVRTNHERSGLVNIEGTTKDLSTASTAAAGWTGTTSEKVKIDQVISLTDDAKYFKVTVTVTNQSSSAVNDVRYLRTVDPDQGGTFNTTNTIVEQQGAKGALVAAYAGTVNPMFFYATDARAVVSTFGFENTDPYADLAYGKPQAEGYSLKGDYAINIEFGLGTLAAGQSTTLTYYMGLTDDLASTIAIIDKGGTTPVPVPANAAPVAVADAFAGLAGTTLTGNVLANDKDADGDALSTALKTGPSNGTLTLNSDGSFKYTPKAGFSGTDSFSYNASDGKSTDSAVVTLTVKAPATTPPVEPTTPTPTPLPPLPTDPVLKRVGTIDLSASTSDAVTGAAYRNSFFVNSAASTGNDRVVNFGHDDVVVTTAAVPGANVDGIITLNKTRFEIDGPTGTDAIRLPDLTAVRSLGQTAAGLFVYADAAVRPTGAFEGTVGDDRLSGDLKGTVAEKFFFDTALGINLGKDAISNFGKTDKIVTTTAIYDGNGDGIIMFTSSKMLTLPGSIGGPGDTPNSNNGGLVGITGMNGSSVTALKFDGITTVDDVHYYSYSLIG